MATNNIHYSFEYSTDFIRQTTEYHHKPMIGLLKEMPRWDRDITLSDIKNTTEIGPTGAVRPRYKAYFPGYAPVQPSWWTNYLGDGSPTEGSSRESSITGDGWRGQWAELYFVCTLDIEEDSNWSNDIVGWYCWSVTTQRLLWIEELESPIFIDKENGNIRMYTEMLSRCVTPE